MRRLALGLVVVFVCALAWAARTLLGTDDSELLARTSSTTTAPVTAPAQATFAIDGGMKGAISRIEPADIDVGPSATSEVTAPPVVDAKPAASMVAIQVIDKVTQAPVSAAHVRIVARDLTDGEREVGVFENDTDEKGLAYLTPAVGNLEVSATSADGRFGLADQFHSGEGPVEVIQIEVESLVTISGVVRDGATGLPIAGAHLRNYASSAMGNSNIRTDEAGWFEFTAWKTGSAATLSIEAERYGAEHVTLLVDPTKGWSILDSHPEVEWRTGDAFVEITLHPEMILHGRAVRADGSPAAGASVRAVGNYASSFVIKVKDSAQTHADDHGDFELPGLRADIPHLIVCEQVDEGIGMAVAAENKPDVGQVEVRPFATVSGTVLDRLARPASGAHLDLEVADYSAIMSKEEAVIARTIMASLRTRVEVAQDGRFSASSLPGADATLVVKLGTKELARQVVKLTPGQDDDIGAIRLNAEVSVLQGWLIDASNQPLAGVKLDVLEADGGREYARVRSAPDGGFRLAFLPGRLDAMVLVAIDSEGRTLSRWARQTTDFPTVLRMAETAQR